MSDRGRHYRNKARWGRKVEVRFTVVDGVQSHEPVKAHTGNISVGGAFIVTPDPLPRGTSLRVSLTMPHDKSQLDIDSEVRWLADSDDEPEIGMGVRFLNLSPEQAQLLNAWFASLTATVDHDDLG